MKAIAYVRVSTDDQKLGAASQFDSIERWCASNGGEMGGVVHVDLGVSGAADLDDRPGLMSALEALEPGSVLVVAKRDRLARDVMNAAMIERLVGKAGATIVATDGAGNGVGPEAEMMRGIINVFAQYERALIRSRTKAALAQKRARGEKTGGDVPYGFVAVREKVIGRHPDGSPRYLAELVPCEDEQVVVRRARALREGGASLRKIGRLLAGEGRLPRTGRAWTAAGVSRMIGREVKSC